MYMEIYEVWQKEMMEPELVKLSDDFYSRIVDYLREIRRESRMIDKKTVKAYLLRRESDNVKRMVRELALTRCKKLLKKIASGEKIPVALLAADEKKLCANISSFAEAYRDFVRVLVQGHSLNLNSEKRKNVVLRFLKDVPAVIGSDLKTYGPFKVEDVASLPSDNADALVKRGFAEKISFI